jgi:hypothetical protein
MPASLAAPARVAFEHQGLPRHRPTAAVAPAARIAWMVARPTTGTSKRMSWPGLATLTTAVPGPASCPARAIVSSVPFHRLDRHHRLVLHAMVWPMSSPAMASAIR